LLTRVVRRPSLVRIGAIVLPAAVLATAFAVAPSFAGSFLTAKKAHRIYLTKKVARKDYLQKSQAPDAPLADAVASTAVFGPKSSTTAVDIPGSQMAVDVPKTTLLVLSFSGTSSCTASTDGVPCQVAVLVDGQPASTGKINFDASGNKGQTVHTVTQTSIVTAGQHTVGVQYAGSSDASVNFGLTNWNLVLQGYPNS
jgi:hypothetical protein